MHIDMRRWGGGAGAQGAHMDDAAAHVRGTSTRLPPPRGPANARRRRCRAPWDSPRLTPPRPRRGAACAITCAARRRRCRRARWGRCYRRAPRARGGGGGVIDAAHRLCATARRPRPGSCRSCWALSWTGWSRCRRQSRTGAPQRARGDGAGGQSVVCGVGASMVCSNMRRACRARARPPCCRCLRSVGRCACVCVARGSPC